MELSLEEREKWDKCLVILNLTKTQETAILDLRGEHIANIHRLFEERSRLNEQVGEESPSDSYIVFGTVLDPRYLAASSILLLPVY